MSAFAELRRVQMELAHAEGRAETLRKAARLEPGFALKATAAEVRVAALRAHAAQLRRIVRSAQRLRHEATLPLAQVG